MKLTLAQLRRVIREAVGVPSAEEKLNSAVDSYAQRVSRGVSPHSEAEADEFADAAARRFIGMSDQEHYDDGGDPEWRGYTIDSELGEDDVADMVYVAVMRRLTTGS